MRARLVAGAAAAALLAPAAALTVPASLVVAPADALLTSPAAALTVPAALSVTPAAARANPTPRTTLPAVESQVMCVTCKIPLTVAQSPQANRERAYIQSLIAQGEDETQIKRSMVEQYGPQVLALPAAHGFDLTVYLVPLAAVALALALLGLMLPKWRRRARVGIAAAAGSAGSSPLDPADAARLEADRARFD
jgi:cytochrome c-type biogenesis protein CcmH